MTKFQAITTALEHICNLDQTPLMLVRSRDEGVVLPEEVRSKSDHTVLNISPQAVRNFTMDELTNRIEFDTRFNGASSHVIVPLDSVFAIYSAESTGSEMYQFGRPVAKEDAPPAPVRERPKFAVIQGGRK